VKVLLMFRDRDFDPKQDLPANAQTLRQDLELDTLLRAMAGDDEFLFDVAHKALLQGLGGDLGAILYRQAVIRDCLKNPAIVRTLYDTVVAAIESKRKNSWGIFSNYPAAILRGSIELLQIYTRYLRAMREIAQEQAHRFDSEAFRTLFAMLERELGDDYLARIQGHLADLKFPDGVWVSAELGRGNAGANYVLRQANADTRGWFGRLLGQGPRALSFRIADRDQAGATALSELQDRGIHLAGNALAQSADHIFAFFEMLRLELAFYVGCLNLRDRLARIGEPVAVPVPAAATQRRHAFHGLYDVCLALSMQRPVVPNAVDADGKSLVIVTGANQGGKSSFLRSIGLAQLMMECGMFVGADDFAAGVSSGVFTHYKREEDKTLNSGKFDEELDRISQVVDHLRPNALVLFNESFAATNEREGSEIARQIVHALLDTHVKIFFVTHMYDFANGVHAAGRADTIFLRADRQPDGTRTFKLVEGEPLATSFGEDLYRKIFGAEAAAVDAR
jgi:hypothetical protein